MTDYIAQFKALAKDLEEYSFLEIVEFTIQPPASVTQLKAVETRLGASLAKPIRDFYKQANGLKLHWRIRPSLDLDATEKLRKKSSDYDIVIAEYIGNPFAIVNLIPIHESIVHRWKELVLGNPQELIDFGGVTYTNKDFRKLLKPFDVMNRELCMAYLVNKGDGNPPVILLSNGYTEWNDSRITDFESYMEMLLATRGIVEAREKIFSSERGDLEAPLIAGESYWRKHYTPKMFMGKKL
jgi:hypothetical protein